METIANRDRLVHALSFPDVGQRIRAIEGMGFTYNNKKYRYELIKEDKIVAWVNDEVVQTGC